MKTKILLVLVVMINTATMAQQFGSVKGKVVERTTKRPVIAANVLVIGTKYGTITDTSGVFVIRNVPENVYQLRVSCIGYGVHIEPDVRVVRDKTVSLRDIELEEDEIRSDSVTVTGGFFNDFKDAPVSNYSYTREEIRRAPGAAGDIFRAVGTLPGVSTNGEFSSFSVRGDTPRDNIILIDNIPFSQVAHFSEADGNLEVQGGRMSIFSQGLIDRADFQAGGFSSKYGGKRASLLSLNLKEGNEESATLYGSYDLTGWEACYDGPSFVDPHTSVLFSARMVDYSTVFKLVNEEGDGTSKFSDFILKTSSDLNPYNKVSLLGVYSTEHHKREPYHFFKSKEPDYQIGNQIDDKVLLGSNWKLLVGQSGLINTSLDYSWTNTYQDEGRIIADPIYDRVPLENEIGVRYPIYVYHIDQTQVGVKSDFSYDLSPEFTLSSGIAIQNLGCNTHNALHGDDTIFVFRSDELKGNNKYLIATPAEVNSVTDKSRMEYAGYLETSISPSSNLDGNVGIRYEYDDLTRQSTLSPRLSGRYKFGALTSVNFAAGVYYQIPDMTEIAYYPENSSLEKERSYHYILGVNHYIDEDLKFDAELYYKKMDRLIVEPSSVSNYAVNSGKGYAYGLDASLLKRFVGNYYGQINYSYAQCKAKDNLLDTYHYSDFNQPHMFNILFGYQLNDSWSFAVKWKYAVGRPRDSYVIHENVLNIPGELRYSKEITSHNTLRYHDFHSLDLRVDYRKQFSKYLAVAAFVDVLNLYNRANETYEEFEPVTGKNTFHSLPMLPTIGVKLEI